MVEAQAYLGLGSRYSYLASTQLDRIARTTAAVFDWIPVNSIDLIRHARPDGSPFEHSVLTGQYAPDFLKQDCKRWASITRSLTSTLICHPCLLRLWR